MLNRVGRREELFRRSVYPPTAPIQRVGCFYENVAPEESREKL
jgi:hypothetical protein